MEIFEAIEMLNGIEKNVTMKDVKDALKTAEYALEKQLPKQVIEKASRKHMHEPVDYYCPVCHKEQKNMFKNRAKGCYCERCGQKLTWEGMENVNPKSE